MRYAAPRRIGTWAGSVWVILFSLTFFGQAHKGVQHGEGPEQHPAVRVVPVPDTPYRVTVAYLPDRPFSGQEVQCLIRLEEELPFEDPLLGSRAPLEPVSVVAVLRREDGSSQGLPLQAAGEAGVYQARHRFEGAGRWRLELSFEPAGSSPLQAALEIPVVDPPVNWPLLTLQGLILLLGISFSAARLVTSRTPARVLSALLLLAVTAGASVAVSRALPSNIPPVTGVLELEALEMIEADPTPDQSQPTLLAGLPQEPRGELFSGVILHAQDRLTEILSPFPGIVSYPEGRPHLGDRVREGQRLAVIENRFNMHDYVHLFPQRWDLLKEIVRLREAQVSSQAAYERAAELLELGTISRREFEQKEAQFQRDRTALEKAEQRLALLDQQIRQQELKTTDIVSPLAGQITQISFFAGQMVYEGDPLFQIADLSVVWMEVYVAPEDLGKLTGTGSVLAYTPALPNRIFQGNLRNVRPDVEKTSNTIRVLFEVPNPQGLLRAGMLMEAYPREIRP